MRINLKPYSLITTGVALTLFLASCSLAQLTAKTESNIKDATNLADNVIAKAPMPDTPIPVDTVRTKSQIWLGNTSAKMAEGDALPARFETDNAVTLVGNREVTLFEIAERITSLTGLQVRIDDLLLERLSGATSTTSDGASSGNPGELVTQATVSYSGKLSGLLDQVASRFAIWWRYKNGVITFYEMETRLFVVYALPTDATLKAEVGNDDSTGDEDSSASGSATSKMTSEVEMQMWKQIEDTIKSLIPSSAKMSISSASGTITVTAPPDSLRKVSRYIREINEKLSRQVAITVKILQVTLNKEHSYGLDLNAAFQSLTSTDFQFSLAGPTIAPATGAGSLTVGIFGDNNKFGGTNAIINALSTQGDTSVITTATVTTMNNKVAPVQVAQNRNYVSGVSSTKYEGDTNPTYSIETSSLNLGFNMDILPRILDHGRLLLLFNMTLNTLLEMEEFVTNDNTVMLPTTETRGFSQEIVLRSGSTLILTGFEQATNSINKSGVGSPDNMLFGGGRSSEDERTVLVILLTPEVLVSPLSPETRVNDM